MKLTIIVVAILIVLILIYLAYLGHVSRTGAAAGLVDGRLTACPGKPNCVCSEYPQDTGHAIEPLAMHGESAGDAQQRLQDIIRAQGGKIAAVGDNYIAATFTSTLFGFVDDIEIRIDAEAGVIHLRSASRVGTSDLGTNARRIETIGNSYREKRQ